MKALGEFIDLLDQTANEKGRNWIMAALPEEYGEGPWQEIMDAPFSRKTVIELAHAVAEVIHEQLNGLGDDSLCDEIAQAGHAFLQEIHTKAIEQGIGIPLEKIDVPLTQGEADDFYGAKGAREDADDETFGLTEGDLEVAQ